jgi:hypothetical protein
LADDEGMTFMMLESGAAVLTLLMGWELRRQRRSWRSVVVLSLISFGVLTAMIIAWRGL